MARTTLRAMENVCPGDGRSPSSASPSARSGSVRSASRRSPTCSSRCLHALSVSRRLAPPDRLRDRAGDRGLPARRARRDGAQEHRHRRTRAGRAGARPADDGPSSPCCAPSSWCSTRSPTPRCALIRVRAPGRGQLGVHPRGGRGAGRGVTRRGPARRRRVRPAHRRARLHREDDRRGADAGGRPRDRTPWVDRRRRRGACARRPATAGSRWCPRTTTCSATSTSRTCSRPTRSVATAWSTTSGSGRSRRSGVSDLLHDALAQLQQRGAHMALVVDADGRGARASRPSRTSSRSWSARSATRPTTTSRLTAPD